MKMKQSFFVKICLLALFVTLTGSQVFAQKVTGVVVDESNTPVAGVNVVVKGTTNGTITNGGGNYSIVPADPATDILSFSFIGLEPKDIKINGQTVINVQLKSSTLEIEEVVAIGYGDVKRSDLTGSVGSVDAEALTERGATGLLESMQGSIAGGKYFQNFCQARC